MMINKRLLGVVPESRKYIACNVLFQWLSLLANIAMMAAAARMLAGLFDGGRGTWATVLITAGAVAVRCVCTILSARMAHLSGRTVKRILREMFFRKLLILGSAYRDNARTSEVVQVAVEGVDQLESYFGAYLPQLFYAMAAPLTLFAVLAFVDLTAAAVLLICVPLIPVTIILIQRWAKKLLGKYWGQYTALGDTFLENLQGLATTKIYGTDEFRHQQMNEQSEHFRRITMKVLSMQLNSITVMDLIAYGGAALGMILGVAGHRAGRVDLYGCLLIILLAADFFLPMRLLGSFFHIAMNGMAASDKIFRLLDLAEPAPGGLNVPETGGIRCRGLDFSYDDNRQILRNLDMDFPAGSFTAIVGESGCGKSTLAQILMGRNRGYTGEVTMGGVPLEQISGVSLMEHLAYVGHQSYLFKGTVRENLLMARPDAGDDALWNALERVKLAEFLRSEGGLDTRLHEKASNLSGGQRQRLALARALLHDSPVYIFDEATSNIDVESENEIMAQIHELARTKTVILISHRLFNGAGADRIYVLDGGRAVESGTHGELLETNGAYARLWNAQQELEQYTKGGKL